MTPTENSASRVRTWQEEADILLSLLNCFVPEREAVFASSEFFTGKQFYDLCLKNEVRTSEELEKKLGPEYKNGLGPSKTHKKAKFWTPVGPQTVGPLSISHLS
jgi:hypothetical protein